MDLPSCEGKWKEEKRKLWRSPALAVPIVAEKPLRRFSQEGYQPPSSYRPELSEAARAVGNIMNKNYDPRIPCHRVVRFDGGVGGYRGGTKKKVELLRKEGAIS